MSVASWPNSIAQFSPVQDFSGPNSVVFAATMNSIFAEIVALESGIGPSPFSGLAYANLNQALTDLYVNKSPSNHSHNHSDMIGDAVGDDHPQYAKVDGSRPFTNPITAPPAASGSQLATLGQVVAYGYATSSSVSSQIAAASANVVRGSPSGSAPLFGTIPGNPQWQIHGGTPSNPSTNASGIAWATWPAFPNATVGFVASCMNGGEVSLSLVNATLSQANMVFVNAFGQPMVLQPVTFSWVALGC
jgi:hypothetical protein